MQGLSIYGEPVIKLKTVGQGNFSQVFLAQTKSGKIAAVKKVKKSAKDKTAYQLAKRQANILNGLHSPNVLELIAIHEQHNYFYLIERFYEGQCLQNVLKKKKNFNPGIAQKIFKGIVKSVEYLVSRKIMHRDLKPDNVIINDKHQVFLIDLGFATLVSSEDPISLKQRFGTPFYMSPEMMSNKSYNSKSDIWSLGVIYYEMLYGNLPYFGNSDAELFKDIVQSKVDIFKKNQAISAKTKSIIKRCLTIDIQKRISWGQLFAECKLLSSNGFRQGRQIYAEDSVVCCSCCYC